MQTLVAAALVLGAAWLGLRWFEKANMYFPSRRLDANPGALGLKFEEFRVPAGDGPMIHGWFVELKPESPVVLLSHGNAGNISHRMDKLKLLREAGASVLLYDYRGYGLSTGSPSEQGTYRDGEAAYRWLTDQRRLDPGRVVFMGESLGGAVAAELALRHAGAGLILESCFTSIPDMARAVFPWLPLARLARFRYDSLAKLPGVRAPVLVLHSPQDDIVPFEMGRRLFAAASEPKAFAELKGDHNEGFLESGPLYTEPIRKFLGSIAVARKETPR